MRREQKLQKGFTCSKRKMKYFIKKLSEKKEPMNVIETVLEAIAGLTVETTSCFVFYEPKIPKELVKLKKKKSR